MASKHGRLGSVAHDRDGLTRQHELPQINGYPLHPSQQDMRSAAGIKDQQLTIIVSMILIELALLRLSRFKRLACLTLGRAASASLVGATRGTPT